VDSAAEAGICAPVSGGDPGAHGSARTIDDGRTAAVVVVVLAPVTDQDPRLVALGETVLPGDLARLTLGDAPGGRAASPPRDA
jgi:hypothetical protein